MFKTHLIFAWRRLKTDKKNTTVTLAGLAIGIAGFLLIMEYVLYEKSYDQFHTAKDRIVRIGLDVYRNNKLNISSAINYAGVGPALKKEYSEVDDYVRITSGESNVRIGTKTFREPDMYFADEGLFNLFSIPLLEGHAAEVLKEPNSAVIAESIALKYFGTIQCAGRMLQAENFFPRRDFMVTGVFKDLPENTHLTGKIFLSFRTFSDQPGFIQPWEWRDYRTYLLLNKNADIKTFTRKITAFDFVDAHDKSFAERKMSHQLVVQRLTDIYPWSMMAHEMKATGNGSILTVLILVAVFVLGMAWINFLNLSTAVAIKRLKEIGIRKAIGAGRNNLILQFLTEAFVVNGIALSVAVVLFFIAKPSFNQLSGQNSHIPVFAWLGLIGFLTAGVLLSVWYPASVLSGFSPLKALKEDKLSMNKTSVVRKALIVFQFAFSITLIIGTVMVLLQLNHMQQAKLGMNIDQNVVVRGPVPSDSATYSTYLAFKNELLKNPDIKSVSASHVVPGDEGHWTPGIQKFGDQNTVGVHSLTASANAIEPGFLEQYEIPVKYGRTLSREFGTDHRSILLSETAFRKLGYHDPKEALNNKLIVMGDTLNVIGITGDFRHFSVKYAPEPYVFFQRVSDLRKYSVKISGSNSAAAIEFIGKKYNDFFPQHNFEYVFADELFAAQYKTESKLGIIISIFTIMAISIACLGLFGLTIFTIQQKMKEIGIRKVLGAAIVDIAILLSGNFVKLVLISLLIAFPVSWLMMTKWLQDYAYRIHMQWWVFAAAGVIALLIAVITVNFHAVKAAMANPVKSLRAE